MTHECVGNRGQECWRCHVPLVCEGDYVGGGSHYWELRCPACDERYQYDTYGFRLYQIAGDSILVAPDSILGIFDGDRYRTYILAIPDSTGARE